MLLFNLIMLNSIWRKRYSKLDNETQDKIITFLGFIEVGIFWIAFCFWARTHI
jgi:hypothetical protein